jgi:hypothetical protein
VTGGGWPHERYGPAPVPLDEPRGQPELADRRQRAAEAFDDAWSGANDMFGRKGWAERLLAAREAAIETATRVRIDDEVIRAALVAVSAGPSAVPRYVGAIKAAFLAAGFEVEQ